MYYNTKSKNVPNGVIVVCFHIYEKNEYTYILSILPCLHPLVIAKKL